MAVKSADIGVDPEDECGPLLSDCRCRPAVERAFAGMIATGASQLTALEVASRVYNYHHPTVPTRRARDVVEIWVYRGCFH